MIQQFILGDQGSTTESQKRKIVLGAYLILIYLGVDLFFSIVNLFNPDGEPISLVAGFIISSFCLILLRYRQTNTAIVLHLLRCSLFAFYFSMIDDDPLQTGSYLYFISSSLGALAVFGFKERWVGIGFTALNFGLFLTCVLKPSRFSPNQEHFYFILSFMITLLIGVLIIIFFDRLFIQSEKEILTKNTELTKINAELDRFVYSASHDLRAPLSSISGLIHLIERSKDPNETEQYLNLMKGRIERLEQFIRDIINFSRNARSEIKTENVNIKELVDEAFEALKYIKGAEVIMLQNELPGSMTIAIDRTRLQIVLFNIISNAIQYMDTNKTQSYVHFSSEPSKGQVIILIDDNGIGIDYSHHPKMFSMFYRASENAKGSGLGLYIVKETMDKLGGTISLQSVLGEGTRLTLKLPIQTN